MKKAKTRDINATSPNELDEIFAKLEAASGISDGITDDDKTGGKISDKEIETLRYVLDHTPKFDNFLRRDFDVEHLNALLAGFDGDKKQLDKLLPIIKHLISEQTIKRIALKEYVKEVYEAVTKSSSKNSAYKFLVDKMKVAYARTASNTDANADATATKTAKENPS